MQSVPPFSRARLRALRRALTSSASRPRP